jgi:hypothetical protein
LSQGVLPASTTWLAPVSRQSRPSSKNEPPCALEEGELSGVFESNAVASVCAELAATRQWARLPYRFAVRARDTVRDMKRRAHARYTAA